MLIVKAAEKIYGFYVNSVANATSKFRAMHRIEELHRHLWRKTAKFAENCCSLLDT